MTEATTETVTPVDDPNVDPDTSGLDEHTQSVVTAVRNDFKAEREKRQAAEAKIADFERLAQEAEDAKKSDIEKANEKALNSELQAHAFRDRAVKAEVKALAASTFADPEDASAFLTLSNYVADDGDIDTKAIQADLEALLERKPHLARADAAHNRPRPDPTQGSGGNTRPSANPGDVFAAFAKQALNH